MTAPTEIRTGEYGHPRNLAINTLRDAGHHNIAAGLREVSYAPFVRPLDLLGLPLMGPDLQRDMINQTMN